MSGVPAQLLADTDLFISYLRGDEFSDRSETVIDSALAKKTLLLVSPEVYDDLITAYRVKGYKPDEVKNILLDLRAIPHEVVPVTLEMSIWRWTFTQDMAEAENSITLIPFMLQRRHAQITP